MGTDCMKVKANATGFTASFQGSKQVIEQSFKSFGESVDWMMAMQAANKAMDGVHILTAFSFKGTRKKKC